MVDISDIYSAVFERFLLKFTANVADSNSTVWIYVLWLEMLR